MAGIEELLNRLTPAQAQKEMGAALKKLFPRVTEELRLKFIMNLIGGGGDDKVASMVHL